MPRKWFWVSPTVFCKLNSKIFRNLYNLEFDLGNLFVSTRFVFFGKIQSSVCFSHPTQQVGACHISSPNMLGTEASNLKKKMVDKLHHELFQERIIKQTGSKKINTPRECHLVSLPIVWGRLVVGYPSTRAHTKESSRYKLRLLWALPWKELQQGKSIHWNMQPTSEYQETKTLWGKRLARNRMIFKTPTWMTFHLKIIICTFQNLCFRLIRLKPVFALMCSKTQMSVWNLS